jgi:type 1 glutamine amidotransferase
MDKFINEKRSEMFLKFVGLFCLVFLSLSLVTFAASPQGRLQVLLITGDDVKPAHNWREMAEATREVLVNSGKFDVRISEDPAILESSSLQQYDLIFLTLYNASLPTLSEQAKSNLLGFVKGGKGFAVSHLASASFKEWAEYKKLCGRNWVMGTSGHGPRSTFKVRIANKTHPVTQGIADFEINDELYAKLQGDAPINVLAEADSDWSHRTEPLAFTLEYGKGRVFHETFGHDGNAIKNPGVQQLIIRGCEWAATGK